MSGITIGMVKLVMDAVPNGSVILVVGSLEIPITREQTIQMLYGEQPSAVHTRRPKGGTA